MTDILRGTLECSSMDAILACAEALGESSRDFTPVHADNRLHPDVDADSRGGYRDVLTLMKCGRHICEVSTTATTPRLGETETFSPLASFRFKSTSRRL